MATVFQLRKFNFFDVKQNVDEGNLAGLLKDTEITCTGSGRGIIHLGDADGFVYSLNRQFQVSTFRAHEAAIQTIITISSSNLLITVQGGSSSHPSEIKVWAPDRIPSSGGDPVCLRVIKPDPRPSSSKSLQTEAPYVTAVSLHPNNAILAVGFSDGSVVLYRGDVRRDRGSKSRVIVTLPGGSVTNLHMKHSVKGCHLFATTQKKTFCINCSTKDKETTVELDDSGCAPKCSTLADSKHENELLIARKDAIYTYTTDSKASCYVFEGQKLSLSWFKGHLIVVSKEEAVSPSKSGEKSTVVLTVYDPVNKLVSLSTEVPGFVGVESEWGGLYSIVGGPEVWYLSEKDLQSKFKLLFKKNQFEIAVNLAKSQCCDEEEISEILTQYGDWLYDKGDAYAAVTQFIKTIPHLEPSHVIEKFLDMKNLDHLTTYLQALHKSGHATVDHTTLMLNCFTRLKDSEKLDEFIKQGDIECDIELAIKVCRTSGFVDHAMTLASKHDLHRLYVTMLVDDKRDHEEALKYISGLDFENAKELILQHGSALLHHFPDSATDLLVSLCTDFKGTKWSTAAEDGLLASPEEFDHLFINQSDATIDFLTKVGSVRPLSTRLNTTLLAELLHQYSIAPEGQDQNAIEEKVLKMLRKTGDGVCVDQETALLHCDKHKFESGKLLLWERAGMFEELMLWHATHGNFDAVVSVCRKHAKNEKLPLWRSALKLLTDERSAYPPDTSLLNEVLNVIDDNDLLPSLEIVSLLTSSPHIVLGQVRDYLLRVVDRQTTSLASEASSTEQKRAEAERIKESIKTIKSDTIEFTGTKCDICNNKLELPSIHFLCRHSFHVHCFESYSESDSDCPVCYPEAKKFRDSLRAQEQEVGRPELLREELEKASDKFSVVADFVGRGAFTRTRSLAELHPSPMTTKDVISVDPFSAEERGLQSLKGRAVPSSSSEGRVRSGEIKTQTIVHESESRLRALEKRNAGSTGMGSEGRLRLSERSTPAPEQLSVGRLRLNDPPRRDPEVVPEGRLRSQYQPSPKTQRVPQRPEASLDPISSAVVSISKVSPQKPVSENPFEESGRGSPRGQNPFGEDFETETGGDGNPFADDDYDDSKNPFAEEPDQSTGAIRKSTHTRVSRPVARALDNPFEDDNDKNLNPFE